MRRVTAVLAVVLWVPVLGCSSSDDGGGGGSGGSSGGGGSGGMVAECTGTETFSAGIEKTGDNGTVKVTIESGDPAPPQVGNNTWMLMITDASGAPINDATVSVTPFMPVHGHGTPVTAVITPKGGGSYEADKVNFVMPGPWEITIDVSLTGGGSDSVMFPFCVEG